MKKITIAMIAVAVLALGAIWAIGQRSGKGGHEFGKGMRHMGGGMMLRGLDLTDEQKAKVKEIMETSRAKSEELRTAMKAGHQKLDELTANGAFDEGQVTAAANEMGAQSAQMIVEKERVKSQIFAILTDEQKAKAAELKAKMKDRFKNRGFHKDAGQPEGSED